MAGAFVAMAISATTIRAQLSAAHQRDQRSEMGTWRPALMLVAPLICNTGTVRTATSELALPAI
jgi:hypothetical protein